MGATVDTTGPDFPRSAYGDYAAAFSESTDPLGSDAAIAEASRCLYCFDAPCTRACPTHIDVPSFIRKISTSNLTGSAVTILDANPLGGTCARVCPTEVLCEGACVRNDIDRPVAIGRLQRYAMDAYAALDRPFFTPGNAAGGRVAVVGAGAAGLGCAVELRRAGLDVTVFEARERAGGLCDYGIVPWRLPRDITGREVAEIERAGVVVRRGVRVGEHIPAAQLLAEHDAVFVAVGLAQGRRLGVPGEDAGGVVDALDLLRNVTAGRLDDVRLGRRVAVIGAGSTALDAAAAAAKLGCDEVTVFYRRSEAEAPAHAHALELARLLGVRFRWLAAPVAISRAAGGATEVTFDTMRLGDTDESGRRSPEPVPGERFMLSFDTVIRAVGHALDETLLDDLGVIHRRGLIEADAETGRTASPKVWAGGDAVNGGREVVHAVEAGKIAARSIIAALGGAPSPRPSSAYYAATSAVAPAAATARDLAVEIAGIRSPNPFWLASAPPTNTGEMIARAFDAGWGGAVWKTVGDPITNVSPRLGAVHVDGERIVGINNIELITDRPIEVNLAEIRDVKRRYPGHAVIVSLMFGMDRDAWHEMLRRVNDTGADGVELNFGCPHGMIERGMGAAIGQVPEYAARITGWVKEVSAVPVFVKLTPNVTDITVVARAVRQAGADGLSMINTINSIVGVDRDTWAPDPSVSGRGTHGGYAGPAVKPIALNMVSACARDPEIGIPISGMGGISDWRDAVEFLLLGASTVQVCTAVMHYGYRIVDDLIDGLSAYLDERGLARPADLVGRTVPSLTDYGHLDQTHQVIARIDQSKCIHCNLCYSACADGGHQSIDLTGSNGSRRVSVVEDDCVGCRLCALVCPVDQCITMVDRPAQLGPRARMH